MLKTINPQHIFIKLDQNGNKTQKKNSRFKQMKSINPEEYFKIKSQSDSIQKIKELESQNLEEAKLYYQKINDTIKEQPEMETKDFTHNLHDFLADLVKKKK